MRLFLTPWSLSITSSCISMDPSLLPRNKGGKRGNGLRVQEEGLRLGTGKIPFGKGGEVLG